jgi:G3E family GTPase
VSTLTTLVIGSDPAAREAAIAQAIAEQQNVAVIIEGLPSGSEVLDQLAQSHQARIARIAPGCPCCSGNLTMRVILNRFLRYSPTRLFISLATSAHLAKIRDFLSKPPYRALLTLTEVQWCGNDSCDSLIQK